MARRFDYFVVLAEMRTGSNAVEDRLNSYADLVCHGELFNPNFVGSPKARAAFGISQKDRDKDPVKLIHAMRKHTAALGGFRLFGDHDPRILDHCLRDQACAKIVLSRNPLESFVSLQIARATGQWWLGDAQKAKRTKVHFDPKVFSEYLAETSERRQDSLRRLQATGQAPFHIHYDDLRDDAVFNGLVRWLGVSNDLKDAPRHSKVQNPVPLVEKVENPEEMLATLADIDPWQSHRIPDFEPSRGPNVPSFLAVDEPPMLFLPIKSGPTDRVGAWLSTLASSVGAPVSSGFTRKALRQWKRRHPAHRSFTVVRHPLPRAHAAFCSYILPRTPESFVGIRDALVQSYGLDLPEDPMDPGYDIVAHRSAFLGFLNFLVTNLAGQTTIRVDGHWASQTECLAGMAAVTVPDRVFREVEIDEALPDLARSLGGDGPDLAKVLVPEPHPLDAIYNAELEHAVRRAYQKDYMMFGFRDWAPDQDLT
ncbi:MAG: nodulation protein NodH [Pseudomonadota bacterium]